MVKLPRPAAHRLALLALLVSLGASSTVSSQPADGSARYWFLDKLGAGDLVPADWALLRQNIQLALYELGDGESVGWVEPSSEHSGSVRVISTTSAGERSCRRIRVSVDVATASDDGIFDLCREGNGFWMLTTSTLALHD